MEQELVRERESHMKTLDIEMAYLTAKCTEVIHTRLNHGVERRSGGAAR